MNPETRLQNQCRIDAGKIEGVLMCRRHVGKYRHVQFPEQIITIGVPGQSDTHLIIETEITEKMVGKKLPVAVEVEFKTDTGRQSGVQKKWQNAVEKISGFYYIIRSRKEFVDLIEKFRRGKLWE